MDLEAQKKKVRCEMAAVKRALAPGRGEAAAHRAATHLAGRPELAEASTVILYAALPDELPSQSLYRVARAAGRTLLFPRVARGGHLEFVSAEWEELLPGRYGVLEPPADRTGRALEEGDLALVPGVAFDRRGGRLGRGRGCWDRSIPDPRPHAVCLVGVGFAFQTIEAVPSGPADRRMDAVLTDEGWHHVVPGGSA